jgi:hypothetical protein
VPGKAPVCLLKAYTSYLTFGFWKGREIAARAGRSHVRNLGNLDHAGQPA